MRNVTPTGCRNAVQRIQHIMVLNQPKVPPWTDNGELIEVTALRGSQEVRIGLRVEEAETLISELRAAIEETYR